MADPAEVFQALADPNRAAMVDRLSRGPATVGELGAGTTLSKPAVTKHLDVLERAGLITRSRRGRTIVCSLDPDRLQSAETWLADRRTFWTRSLDRLADLVEESHD